MKNLSFRHATDRAILWFWPFQSIPRLWYLASAGLPGAENPVSLGVAAVVLGILHDGLLVAALLLAVRALRAVGAGRLLPDAWRGAAGAVAGAALAVTLAGLIADSEFFRYFGFHATLTHLTLATEWEKVSSSLSLAAAPIGAVAMALLLPAAFLWTVARSRVPRFLRFVRSGAGLAATCAVALVGVLASAVAPANPVAANLSENAIVAAAEAALPQHVAPDVRHGADLVALVDPSPLPRPGVSEPAWRYFDPEYPLVKATPHHLCVLGVASASGCDEDADGDGYPLATDCDDGAAGIHPGAEDRPRNGIDEDCSGLDADPPNVIFVHWEGVRAVNVGSIGDIDPATPRFDALARNGVLFRNAYANGTQTRWSLVSVYCSTLPRLSNQWIFKHNPNLELLCFPDVLHRLGYETIYVHGGFIGFAGKGPRMSQWFETRYDRTNAPINRMRVFNWGALDRDVLGFTYDMLKERTDPRPFFLAIATLAVHHPFGLPEPRFAEGSHTDPRNQLANVIRYSDDALGEFLERVLRDPQFENTLIVVSSDHGINWFHPHPERVQSILWEDLVWVPLALLGNGWNTPPAAVDEVRQLADIGPTILDRLGVQIPNPFIGHSLLRRFGDREATAWFGTANGGRSAGLRRGPYKFFEHFDSGRRYLFDVDADRAEARDLSADPALRPVVDEMSRAVTEVYEENEQLIEENRIWSERYWIPGGASR